MEPSQDILKEAILGPMEELELGIPMAQQHTKSMLAGRNPKLPPKQWLSDPLRRRIDAALDVPAAMLALRNPPIHHPSQWEKARPWVVSMVLGLLGGGLLVWGIWRAGWLH